MTLLPSRSVVLPGAALWLVAVVARSPAAPLPTAEAATHEVAMVGSRFVPAHVVAQSGDTVAFVNGNGGPHNAAFWPDSLPPGARNRLAAVLPDTIGPMVGPLLFAPAQRWSIVLDGVPPGRYPYFCLPHVSGGMVGAIEVRGEE